MEAPVEKVDVLAATEEAGGEEASEALALLTQMILIIIELADGVTTTKIQFAKLKHLFTIQTLYMDTVS